MGVCLAGDVSGRMDDTPATAALVTTGDAVVATAGGYLRTYDGEVVGP